MERTRTAGHGQKRRRAARGVLISSALSGLLFASASWTGVFDGLERGSLDMRVRFAPAVAPPEIALVGIDEGSLRELKRSGVVWKWPRDVYALVVRHLQRGGARAVVFDVLFPEPDMDRAETDAEETDGAFARAMSEAGNVVLPAHFSGAADPLLPEPPLEVAEGLKVTPPGATDGLPDHGSAVLPIGAFQRSAAGIGAANLEIDPDGVCRRIPPILRHQGRDFAHLGLAAFLLARGAQGVERAADGRSLRVGERTIPLTSEGDMLLRWYGPGGPGGAFPWTPISSVIGSAIAEESGRGVVGAPSSSFRDKIVLIGATAPGLVDIRTTPWSAQGPFAGVEIHATALANLLQGRHLRRPGRLHGALAALFGALLVGWSFGRRGRLRRPILTVTGLLVSWTALALGAFVWADLWIDLVTPALGTLCAFVLAATISYAVEGRARQRLRHNLDRYVSASVAEAIVASDDDPGLGGKLVTGSVLFSDIAGFTSISERMAPRELVDMLCAYFRLPTDLVLEHGGFLDKYIGDAIMAVFGAPIEDPAHPIAACATAVEIQRTLRDRWPREHPELPPLHTRIGVATGEMIVGNIGSSRRFDYTAIGDTVNLAARLEGANKVFGTQILISDATAAGLDDRFLVRPLSPLGVKGKERRIRVHEVLGLRDRLPSERVDLTGRFAEALARYEDREFAAACEAFETILDDHGDDGPSRAYLARARTLREDPPDASWTASITLDSK